MTRSELWIGREVTWIHRPRGGYSMPVGVHAIVLGHSEKRVRISVLTRAGRVERVVDGSSLRPRRK